MGFRIGVARQLTPRHPPLEQRSVATTRSSVDCAPRGRDRPPSCPPPPGARLGASGAASPRSLGDVDADRVDHDARPPPRTTSARFQRTKRAPPRLEQQVGRGRRSAPTRSPPAAPDHLARVIPGHAFEPVIPSRDAPVVIEREHEGRHRLDQLAVAFFGVFQVEAQAFALSVEPRLVERAANGVEQIRGRHRFEHVGERVAAHGGDRAFQRRIPRDQDAAARTATTRATESVAKSRHRRGAERRSVRRRSDAPARARARSCDRVRWRFPRPRSRRSLRRSPPAPHRRRQSGQRRSYGEPLGSRRSVGKLPDRGETLGVSILLEQVFAVALEHDG